MAPAPNNQPSVQPPEALHADHASASHTGPWLPALIALACFANSLGNDFTYDDNSLVKNNARIRSLWDFHGIWLTDWWNNPTDRAPIVDPARDRLYRPLTLFSFAVNYAAGGLDPRGYHGVNIVLHALVSSLVWLLAQRLFCDRTIALIAGVCFAVHPVHCEAIAGVVGRAEVLAAALLLAGLLTLTPKSGAPGMLRTAASALIFLAALLAKETAICFPLVALLVLHHGFRERRPAWRWWLSRAAILVAPVALYLPLRHAALEGHLIRTSVTSILFNPLFMHDLFSIERLIGPFTILGHYARLLIAPATLSCDYGLAIFDPAAGVTSITIAGMLALSGLLIALWGYRCSAGLWRRLAVLSALLLASYVLISNTVLLIGVSLAERLMYWPSVPVVIAVAVAARALCGPGGRYERSAGLLSRLGIILLVALAARSMLRNMDWKEDRILFATDLATYPQGAHLNTSLARMYIVDAGRAARIEDRDALLRAAHRMLDRALEISPRLPAAIQQRGFAYLIAGQREQALRFLEQAVVLNPADKQSQARLAALRGVATPGVERLKELEAAIRDRPEDLAARVELGRLLITLGRNAEALAHLEHAFRAAPDDLDVLSAYGDALLVNFLRDEALPIFQKVVALDPDNWAAHAALSQLYSDRDAQAAFQHAERAYELHPQDLRLGYNLAEAYVLRGEIEQALQLMRAVERALPTDNPFHTVVRARIAELEQLHP